MTPTPQSLVASIASVQAQLQSALTAATNAVNAKGAPSVSGIMSGALGDRLATLQLELNTVNAIGNTLSSYISSGQAQTDIGGGYIGLYNLRVHDWQASSRAFVRDCQEVQRLAAQQTVVNQLAGGLQIDADFAVNVIAPVVGQLSAWLLNQIGRFGKKAVQSWIQNLGPAGWAVVLFIAWGLFSKDEVAERARSGLKTAAAAAATVAAA